MLVYHYTNIDTLEKILAKTSKENPTLTLRATHCNFLNDGSENTLGCMVLAKCIGQIEEDLNLDEKYRISSLFNEPRFINLAINDQRTFDDHAESEKSYYVISFSKDEDSLVMWSMYGNKGDGVALGFDTDGLVPIEEGDCSIANYLKGECLYWTDLELSKPTLDKDSKLYGSIKEIYSQMSLLDVRKALKVLYLNEVPDGLMDFVINETIAKNLISFCSIFHKLGMWQNEHEYRVSMTDPFKTQYYKSASGTYIPYTEVAYPLKALKEIMIGPKCGRNAYGMVRSLFLNRGFDKGNIPALKESRCPLQ